MQQEQYIYINKCGHKIYYKDRAMTICHRLDGPAVEYADGYKEWCVDGKRLSEEQFNALTAPALELTLEDIASKFGVDVSKIKIKK
jgi:hypothetical protein